MVSTIDPERMVTRGDDNYGFAISPPVAARARAAPELEQSA